MVGLNDILSKLNNNYNYVEYLQKGKFVKKTYAELIPDIENYISFLKQHGVKPKDKIAIYLDNTLDFILVEIACILSGITTIALDKSSTYDFQEIKNKLKFNYLLCNDDAYKESFVISLTQLSVDHKAEKLETLDLYSYAQNEVFTIMSTSTNNKFIEIKVSYFDEMINEMLQLFPVTKTDSFLLFLPLNIYWARTNFYYSVLNEYNIVLCPIQYVFVIMKKNKPSIITGIPAFYEAVENSFVNKIKQNKKGNFILKLYTLCKKMHLGFLFKNQFKPFTDLFGGNIKYLFTGSAPIKQSTIKFYKRMGIKMFEGYGMTEIGGKMISMNTPENYKIGSVGKLLKGNQIQLSDEGEIIIKSNNAPHEYYYSENNVNTVFKEELIHTGDIGYLDSENFLFIKGRKDLIITLKSGVKIHPNQFENEMKSLECITNCVIFSVDDLTLTAIIIVENKKFTDEFVHGEIEKLKLKSHQKLDLVKKTIIRREKFTVENKMLTSNFKINRKVVVNEYLKHKSNESKQ